MSTHYRQSSSSTSKSEINFTSNPHLWDWLLCHTRLDQKETIGIDRKLPWYHTNFIQYLQLLEFDPSNFCFTNLNVEEINKIDWNFLKSNRYQDAEVFKEHISLLNDPSFLLQLPHVIKNDGRIEALNFAQIIYDYYRRFLPFLYALVKLVRSQQKSTIELKIPIVDLFFSNFGCIKTGIFNSNIPIHDLHLISIIEERFKEFCKLRAEEKFGRAISQMTDIVRGLAEYLKILSTVHIFDQEFIEFLHSSFMAEKYERYNLFFEEAGDEDFVLRNLGWTYTKAFQLSCYATM